MANNTELKNAIAQIIKTNDNQEITGQVLQNTLNNIISSIGSNATFAGIAIPTTSPGTPDQNVFYFAVQAGTYVNFGGLEIKGGFNIIKNNTSGNWVLSNVYELVEELGDSETAVISQKAVTTELVQLRSDLSEINGKIKYAIEPLVVENFKWGNVAALQKGKRYAAISNPIWGYLRIEIYKNGSPIKTYLFSNGYVCFDLPEETGSDKFLAYLGSEGSYPFTGTIYFIDVTNNAALENELSIRKYEAIESGKTGILYDYENIKQKTILDANQIVQIREEINNHKDSINRNKQDIEEYKTQILYDIDYAIEPLVKENFTWGIVQGLTLGHRYIVLNYPVNKNFRAEIWKSGASIKRVSSDAEGYLVIDFPDDSACGFFLGCDSTTPFTGNVYFIDVTDNLRLEEEISKYKTSIIENKKIGLLRDYAEYRKDTTTRLDELYATIKWYNILSYVDLQYESITVTKGHRYSIIFDNTRSGLYADYYDTDGSRTAINANAGYLAVSIPSTATSVHIGADTIIGLFTGSVYIADVTDNEPLERVLEEKKISAITDNKSGLLYDYESVRAKVRENTNVLANVNSTLPKINDKASAAKQESANAINKSQENANEIQNIKEYIAEYKPIVINGNVTNAPDEEDITADNTLLKLKDRSGVDGMGYVILRNNKSLSEQLQKQNTIFEVRYALNVSGTVEIGNNSILLFNGGKFIGGTIVGNNTEVIAPKKVVFEGCVIDGTWNNSVVHTDWLDFKKSENADDLQNFQNLMVFANGDCYTDVYIREGIYYSSMTRSAGDDKDSQQTQNIMKVPSNTYIHNNGVINMKTNDRDGGSTFFVKYVKNVTIDGGEINGDVETHTGTTGEYIHGIFIEGSDDVTIKNIKCQKFWGDGIDVEDGISNHSIECHNIFIDNVKCLYNRRQGLSFDCCRHGVVSNSEFAYTGYYKATPPVSGIDVEPSTSTSEKIQDVRFVNCYSHDNGMNYKWHKDDIIFNFGNTIIGGYFDVDVHIYVQNCRFDNIRITSVNGVRFINCEGTSKIEVNPNFDSVIYMNEYGLPREGTTEERPKYAPLGFMYFDTTIQKYVVKQTENWSVL